MTKRTIWIVMFVAVLGLLTYSPMVYAVDTITTSLTSSEGLKGPQMKTLFTAVECPMANCGSHGVQALSSWLTGGWFEPRGGTDFIPASGDHHRAGWRLMLTPAFSAGDWLTGFGGQTNFFPWYPALNVPGAGESPELILNACNAGVNGPDGIANSGDEAPAFDGPDVDLVATCAEAASQASLRIGLFLDNHGEPLTPGRFPRYIPHERQAWVGTVVSKYTASNLAGPATSNNKLNQLFTSMHKIVQSGRVTWFSMHDQNGNGCTGGWCQWLWDAATSDLRVVSDGTANPGNHAWRLTSVGAFVEGSLATGVPVTTTSILNDVTGLIDTGRIMNGFEKAPSEIYQVVGQWLQHGSLLQQDPANTDVGTQSLWSEFWGLSGPNFQAMEGINPNTWVLCGANTGGKATETNCVGLGPSDSPNVLGDGVKRSLAITNFGHDITQRWGFDGRPAGPDDLGKISSSCAAAPGAFSGGEGLGGTIDQIVGSAYLARATALYGAPVVGTNGAGGATDACDAGLGSSTVICVVGGNNDGNVRTSDCDSRDGSTVEDGIYGNGGEEITYTAEVTEEGLRAYLRLDKHFAFSFLNGLAANFADIAGHNDNSGMFKSMRQSLVEEVEGFLMSCMNCEGGSTTDIKGHRLAYPFSFGTTLPDFEADHTPPIGPGIIEWSSP